MPPEETTSSEIDRNIKAILAFVISPAEESHNKAGPGQSANYKSYRTPGDLSSTAKKLFEMAGTSPYLASCFTILTASPANVSGTGLDTLVRAVYMLEQRIIVWQKQQTKADEQKPGSERWEKDPYIQPQFIVMKNRSRRQRN